MAIILPGVVILARGHSQCSQDREASPPIGRLDSNRGQISVRTQQNKLGLGQSPINVNRLQYYLEHYPAKNEAHILRNGFKYGFKLGFHGPRQGMECKNLKSAYVHPKETQEKIDKEVTLGRIVGPFEKTPVSNLKISPIGIIPKPDQSWRLITHLSYPNGRGVNSGIPDEFATVKYTSFDKVIDMIFQLGKNTLLAKRDIKSAFRLLPVHPEDYQLLGIKINGKIYVDKFLLMGG